MIDFKDKSGEWRKGKVIREYRAFEGDMRYIVIDEITGRDYRCVKKNGEYVELVI